MMVQTISGKEIESTLLDNYFHTLVNRIFKILPMRENNEESLGTYLVNLRDEMLGCQGMIPDVKANSLYAGMMFTIQYLVDVPDCSIEDVKSKVFGAISMCNKIASSYSKSEVSAK